MFPYSRSVTAKALSIPEFQGCPLSAAMEICERSYQSYTFKPEGTENPSHWLTRALSTQLLQTPVTTVTTWHEEMTCASRAGVWDLIPHKTFRLPGRRGFYYFYKLPTQHQPMSSLSTSSCSHPSSIQPPRCLLAPCYLKQQQSATNMTCYSSGFLASHPKISPQPRQLATLLPWKISASAATVRVWPVFPTAIWSQRLSPACHKSCSCNSVKMRSPHPPCSRLLCGFFQEL